MFPGFSYSFLLSDASVNVVLNALSAITNVNVVSAPQLLVLNNQTAQLQVGQQVPVPVQQQQSTLVAGAPLVNTINYVNTGVILSVTPRANATGEVTLDIEQEVSDVATVNTGTLNAPTLDERRIKSTVSVDSGESVALGGLISNSVTKTRSAHPAPRRDTALGRALPQRRQYDAAHRASRPDRAAHHQRRRRRARRDRRARTPHARHGAPPARVPLMRRRRAERGAALLIVLWMLLLLSLLAAAFLSMTRADLAIARNGIESARARALADAGVTRAVLAVADADPERRWRADGTRYAWRFGGGTVTVTIVSESGKIDLNTAPEPVLESLFHSAGADDAASARLADAALARRAAAPDPQMAAAGGAIDPGAPAFAAIEDLGSLPGIAASVLHGALPLVTVYSGTTTVDPMSAPRGVLLALPGATRRRSINSLPRAKRKRRAPVRHSRRRRASRRFSPRHLRRPSQSPPTQRATRARGSCARHWSSCTIRKGARSSSSAGRKICAPE